jgi:predicted aspartyl protease
MKRAIYFIFILLAATQNCLASENQLPFRLYRDFLILANCSVADQPGLRAIIDTGTTETILDLGLVQRLSLASWSDSATSLTTDSAVRGVSIRDLQLGPLRLRKLDGIAMDLSNVGRALGVRPDVVIGMDVLHRANLIIDYKAQTITFGSSPALSHGAPLVSDMRFVLLDSNVLGRSLRLKLDTGFNSLLLYGERLDGLVQPVDTGARIAGVAQESSVRSVNSPEVRIGNWLAYHMIVSVIDGAPRDVTEYDGLLGPRLLNARRVTFDFDHHMLYWD